MSTYCPACAESVESATACPMCGLALNVRDPAAPLKEQLVRPPLYDTVVLAEDTVLIGQIVKEGLVSAGLAARVTVAEDGQEFLARFADYLYSDFPVDLAIVDMEMPVLRGDVTALAMRAFEEGCHTRRTPIIFFTSRPVDDGLLALIRAVKPAHYLNKGQDASPERIVKRLGQIMRALQM